MRSLNTTQNQHWMILIRINLANFLLNSVLWDAGEGCGKPICLFGDPTRGFRQSLLYSTAQRFLYTQETTLDNIGQLAITLTGRHNFMCTTTARRPCVILSCGACACTRAPSKPPAYQPSPNTAKTAFNLASGHVTRTNTYTYRLKK